MTTTVKVNARAWGAIVTIATVSEGEVGHDVHEEIVELGTHEDRTFHIHPDQQITVKHGKAPVVEPLNGDDDLPVPVVTPAPKAKAPTVPLGKDAD